MDMRYLKGFQLIILIILLILLIKNIDNIKLSILLLFMILGSAASIFIDSTRKEIKHKMGKSQHIFLIIVFNIILIFCILLYRNSFFERPSLFFIGIAFNYVLIIIQIIYSNQYRIMIFIELFLLNMVMFLSYFQDIYVYQSDPISHLEIVSLLINNGGIGNFAPYEINPFYSEYPFFHIFTASYVIVTDTPVVDSQLLLSQLGIITMLFVYVIIKKISNDDKISLFSIILFSQFPLIILYTYVITTECYSMLLLVILLYLIVSLIIKKNVFLLLLLVIVFICLSYTHPLYSIISLLIIGLFTAGSLKKETVSFKPYRITILFLIIWLGKLFYSNLHRGPILGLYESITKLRDSLSYNGGITSVVGSTGNELFSILLNNGGFYFYILIAICSFFILIKSSNKFRNSILFLLFGYISFSVIALIIGKEQIFGSRSYFFLIIPIILASSFYVMKPFLSLYDKKCSKSISMILIGLLLFMLITSNISNLSNQRDPLLFEGESPMLFYHTNEEVITSSHMLGVIPLNSSIITDYRTGCRGGFTLEKQALLREFGSEVQQNGNMLYFQDTGLTQFDSCDYKIINQNSMNNGFMLLNKETKLIESGYYVDSYTVVNATFDSNKLYSSTSIFLYFE